jgi:hypothetical protein
MTVRESIIEGHLRREVKKLRGRTVKIRGVRGWPDRLVLLPGRMFFVETKRPKGGRFEPLQEYTHRVIRRMGHTVHVCYTKQQVDECLELS